MEAILRLQTLQCVKYSYVRGGVVHNQVYVESRYGGAGKSENLARGRGCLNKSSKFEVRILAGMVTRAGEASVGEGFDSGGGMWACGGLQDVNLEVMW